MGILKSTAVYFALVFGAGFVFGAIRVPFLVPAFGERVAVLIETPFLLVAIVLAARHVSRRFRGPRRGLLAVGAAAAGLVLAADVVVGAMRGLAPVESLVPRDAVAGAAYYTLLGVFAVAPWAWGRFGRSGSEK